MTDSKKKWKSPLERLLNNDGDDPVFRPLKVTVKPLEWNGGIELADGQKVWAAIAEGMEFTYSIWGGGAGDDGRFFCAKVLPQHFDSLDEAKAAVQQNYNERILAAIV